LDEALVFVAKDSPHAARVLVGKIWKAFDLLCHFPRAGHEREDLVPTPDVLFWVAERYFIIYRVADEEIAILAVLHTSRDIHSVLAERLDDPEIDLSADAAGDEE
jgi:plasmid stabilization system protein ParE